MGGEHRGDDVVLDCVGRLTPAWAGSTLGARRPTRGSGAHPRMGGEHCLPPPNMILPVGSPPHGRGAPPTECLLYVRHGLTPAWAGSTTGPKPDSCSYWAHPRMGGEHRQRQAAKLSRLGSPPHGRGAQKGDMKS